MKCAGSGLCILACVLGTVVAGIDLGDHVKAGKQSYRVKGKLLCGSTPAVGVDLKLVDIDIGIDDVMARGVTDENGEFNLLGDATDMATTIDPHLKIYHDCDDSLPCQRRWKFELPDTYITVGRKTNHNKVLDFGTWNLEVVMPEEEMDCDH